MKLDSQSNNLFMKQVSKLIEDLSSIQSTKPAIKQSVEPPSASPRITCTRLRRLREIRRELVLDVDSRSHNELIPAATSHQNSEGQCKVESFAVDKTKQIPCIKRAQAPGGFSPIALQKVAKDPATPASTLKRLSVHHVVEVRQAVAANENSDCEILGLLVRDSADCVKEAALGNKNMRREDIIRLCDDLNPLIAEKAKSILYQMAKQAIMVLDNVLVGGRL